MNRLCSMTEHLHTSMTHVIFLRLETTPFVSHNYGDLVDSVHACGFVLALTLGFKMLDLKKKKKKMMTMVKMEVVVVVRRRIRDSYKT